MTVRRICATLVTLLLLSSSLSAQTPSLQDVVTKLQALLAELQQLVTPAASGGKMITLGPSDDLQAALNAATCGDTLLLPTNGLYTGAFTAAKTCTQATPITVMSAGFSVVGRVSEAAILPKLRISAGNTTVLLLSGTGYVIRGLDILGGSNTLMTTGSYLTIDQNQIRGEDAVNHVRGIALNGDHVTVTNNIIENFHAAGQDSQAICGWNGPGPYTITNNYLEAASENILFGGADPSTPNLVPSNITITGNYLTKRLAWRSQSGWDIKNVLELKNASHVTISGNTLENSWADAQAGYLLMLTVRNQEGGCPWCVVSDVSVTGNVFRHGGGFVDILAVDDSNPSGQAARITISGNLVYDIDAPKYTGAADASGRLLQVLNGVAGLTFDHNTLIGGSEAGAINSLVDFVNGTFPLTGFVYTNTVTAQGDYGILAQGSLGGPSTGTGVLTTYAPGYVWAGNTIQVTVAPGAAMSYPPGTVVGTLGQVVVQPQPSFVLAPGFTGGANIAGLLATIPGLDLTK